jgi:hypothetical protein
MNCNYGSPQIGSFSGEAKLGVWTTVVRGTASKLYPIVQINVNYGHGTRRKVSVDSYKLITALRIYVPLIVSHYLRIVMRHAEENESSNLVKT